MDKKPTGFKEGIELKEFETLKMLNFIFHSSLDEFDTYLSNSLKYIPYITLPIIMASLEGKSYNPFANIIEKYISYIVNKKMIDAGYNMLPLGYSSDLCFEKDDLIINIDIKTANINNPSDFSKEIALGFNQTTYPASLPTGKSKSSDYVREGIDVVKVYSNIPSIYKIDSEEKLNLTFGLLFIYPDYKEIIDNIKNDFKEIENIVDSKLLYLYRDLLTDEGIHKFLNYKPSNSKFTRKQIIIDNLIRGIFIHRKRDLNLTEEEKNIISLFNGKIIEIAKSLMGKEIKPVAIVSISIPSGLLAPNYNDEIVSGKDYGYSIRYHYGDGKFKLLDNKSRVIFIDYNNNYLENLKKYFDKIIKYETIEREQ